MQTCYNCGEPSPWGGKCERCIFRDKELAMQREQINLQKKFARQQEYSGGGDGLGCIGYIATFFFLALCVGAIVAVGFYAIIGLVIISPFWLIYHHYANKKRKS